MIYFGSMNIHITEHFVEEGGKEIGRCEERDGGNI